MRTRCNEEQVVIEHSGRFLNGVLYRAGSAAKTAITICPPIFEERKSSHRVLVEFARHLCTHGITVLRFDYAGCGDSQGCLREYNPTHWLEDIGKAVAFVRERAGIARVGLCGLRVGASLAVEAVAKGTPVDFVILWQPVMCGRDYLLDELRKTLMKQMITFGGARTNREALVARLEAGYSLDFDGYPLTPRLYQELCGIDLYKAARHIRCPALVTEISHQAEMSEAFTDLGRALANCSAELQAVRCQPFWNLLGLVQCPDLIVKTTEWMTARCSGTE
ncbi:MAG: alpha/beta hydrolase [Candidatus Pacebacteria bacterium]|nr:alpha/beta hydrolase [Candidatus Paceibacterota bacterium]